MLKCIVPYDNFASLCSGGARLDILRNQSLLNPDGKIPSDFMIACESHDTSLMIKKSSCVLKLFINHLSSPIKKARSQYGLRPRRSYADCIVYV